MRLADEQKELKAGPAGTVVAAGRVADCPPGSARNIRVSPALDIALYNIEGEFFASENLCPHQGAPLVEGTLCGHTIECALHGWQFDVRSGECLTVPEKIKTYEVLVEDGLVKIVI